MNERKSNENRMRMDFIQEVISVRELADGSAEIQVKMIPNPKRYDKVVIDGEEAYKDKYTGYVIPLKVLAESAPRMKNIPIYASSPKQNDARIYLQEAKQEMLSHWDKKYELFDTEPSLYKVLKKNKGKETLVVILYVDMEGSTRISSTVEPEINAKIVKIFLMQMAKAIDNYNGAVLKYVGDCVIGIFPAEINFTTMCDYSVQSAMTMRGLVEQVINPVFKEKGLPEIGFHIGIDVGNVIIDNVGASSIASFIDLIGYQMNLTAKIQAKAGHNDILIGNNLFELLHCTWQDYCTKIKQDDNKPLIDPKSGKPYDIYRFMAKWDCNIN